MTTYLSRQAHNRLYDGLETSLKDAGPPKAYMLDANRRYQLVLADGDVVSNVVKLDASDTYTVVLPANYTDASRLAILIRTDAVIKVDIDSPTHGDPLICLVKGTNGTSDGSHYGWFSAQMDVTEMIITAVADAQIAYYLYKIPDLTVAASYREGSIAFGTV